ncbi:MAG: hypothetical protein K8H89_15855 [Flavobacteriales bacterium]|jgi:hypothetical protein|nr:hypothetical protein [Flavobacteriales bacterium]MCB0757292.1 hypothetical protein [Flavobacteriales bacterium]
MKTKHILLPFAVIFLSTAAYAQKAIYSYAVGNWRNGPTVEISPLFETSEMYTTPQVIQWVREQWPAFFTDTTDIDVLFFTDIEGGQENRQTLKAKYGLRKLPVHLIEADPMPRTPPTPARAAPASGAPQ